MSPEKKAFKVVYRLIKEDLLAEKEAYSLIDGIFQKEYYPVAVPTPIDATAQENQQEQPQNDMGFMVQGFAPLK